MKKTNIRLFKDKFKSTLSILRVYFGRGTKKFFVLVILTGSLGYRYYERSVMRGWRFVCIGMKIPVTYQN